MLIVFVGIPGSGKTTTVKELAKLLKVENSLLNPNKKSEQRQQKIGKLMAVSQC